MAGRVNTHSRRRRGSLVYLQSIRSQLEALKDTVNNAATLDVSVLGKVELDELPKATGVIVVHRLGVPKGLHDRAAIRGGKQSAQKGKEASLFYMRSVCPSP